MKRPIFLAALAALVLAASAATAGTPPGASVARAALGPYTTTTPASSSAPAYSAGRTS